MEYEAEILASRKMGKRGRLQIPKEVREKLKLKPGVLVLFIEEAQGRIFLQKAPKLKGRQLGKYT